MTFWDVVSAVMVGIGLSFVAFGVYCYIVKIVQDRRRYRRRWFGDTIIDVLGFVISIVAYPFAWLLIRREARQEAKMHERWEKTDG